MEKEMEKEKNIDMMVNILIEKEIENETNLNMMNYYLKVNI